MNSISASTLRPGLLVSLKTSISGNVHYDKVDLEVEKTEDGADRAKWETTRIITDRVEYEAARKARGKVTSLIRSVCSFSAFGLLCPEDRSDELDAAIKEARSVAEDFNANASLTRVHVYVIAGRVAQDDVEAVRAINSEVRDLLADMAGGVEKLDVQVIRQAASKAKQLGNMLSPTAEARVRIAIDTAREAARKIVKAGETAAIEVDRMAMRKITEQRTAFLDMGDQGEIATPQVEGRAIEMESTNAV